MSVDDALRHAELGAMHDAGILELQGRHDGRVARKQHVERLVVHERAVLERVVAGPQGVLDPLVRPAVAGHFQLVVVRLGHHGVHLLERHAQRVVVVGVGRRGVARGIGLHPFDAILDQLADRAATFVRPVDQQHQPLHADLAKVGVPIHQAADAANLATAGRQSRAGSRSSSIALLQPDVDVEQAAAAAGRRIAALQRQPRVDGREQRHVLDRILDVEIFELRHVEIGRMKVRLDQPRHDRAAASVDPRGVRLELRCFGGNSGVRNPAVANHDGRVWHRRRSAAIDQLPIRNDRSALRRFHWEKQTP